MKRNLLISCMLVLTISVNFTVLAQTKEQDAEISSSVPELRAFHTIIYPMWHKAYPAKDTAAFKAFVPQIKANMEKMNAVTLPGILRERVALWKSSLEKFNADAADYYQACSGSNVDAMLTSVERFHKGYEAMNRVIKPFTPDMDAYHQTLYVIIHKLYPANDYAGISALMDKFVAQADTLTKYPEEKLTRRLKDKTPNYYTATKELYTNTVALKETLKAGDLKKNAAAVDKLHVSYKKLEAVFN